MKLFKFDSKTGKFEFCMKDYVVSDDFKVLKYIAKKGYGDPAEMDSLFTNVKKGDRYNYVPNALHRLRKLEMIMFRDDQNVCTHRNKKDYSKSKWEKKSGYFLTTLGKAFIHSLGFPIEK